MTIGEKIKYYRERFGLTQEQLANAASIHPVSIRKYETNKTIPKKEQAEKIANVLNISPNTLIGSENLLLRLETIGDYMSVLNILIDNKFLTIEGDMNEQGYLESSSITLKSSNPRVLEYLSKIEKADRLLNSMLKESLPDESHKIMINTTEEIKELAKMQSESDPIIFDNKKKGLSVKIPPDLSKYLKK